MSLFGDWPSRSVLINACVLYRNSRWAQKGWEGRDLGETVEIPEIFGICGKVAV